MNFQITKDRCARLATLGDPYDIAAGGVASNAVVRLVAPLAGQYCKLEAGEIITIVPMYQEGGKTIWRVARKAWTNSLAIYNVLAGVPDDKLIVEELNVKDQPTRGA